MKSVGNIMNLQKGEGIIKNYTFQKLSSLSTFKAEVHISVVHVFRSLIGPMFCISEKSFQKSALIYNTVVMHFKLRK